MTSENRRGTPYFNVSERPHHDDDPQLQIRSFTPSPKRPGELGVHSLDHFSLTVPKISVAEDFYAAFGLDLKADGNQLGLTTLGNPHRWEVLTEGPAKKLKYVSFGAYEEDIEALRKRITGHQAAGPAEGFRIQRLLVL